MPHTYTVPSKHYTICAPCQYHKLVSALFGKPGNTWRDYNCMHPEAFNDEPLSDDPKVAAKQSELRGRLSEDGRHIGETAAQPEWCPLLREKE